MELILSLIAGAVGGNVAGGVLKKFNLGMIGNSIAGIAGGGIGGTLLSTAGADLGGLVGSLASGGAGGAVVLAIVGVIRNAMAK